MSEPSETGRKPVSISDTGKRESIKQQHASREHHKTVKLILKYLNFIL